MHSKGGSFAAFRARAKSILGYASHGIDHGVPKLKEFFLLLARKRIEFFSTIVQAQENGWRLSRCSSRFGSPGRTFCDLGCLRARLFRRRPLVCRPGDL